MTPVCRISDEVRRILQAENEEPGPFLDRLFELAGDEMLHTASVFTLEIEASGVECLLTLVKETASGTAQFVLITQQEFEERVGKPRPVLSAGDK